MQENFTLSLAETAAAEVMSLEQAEVEIKARAALVIENIIVIGRILIGVKSSLEHGQFSNWLRDQVNFSQSTANNYMRVAREVDQASTLKSLPYSKVLALLDVPADERETFAVEHKVNDLSTSEIKRLVKEKEAAEQEAERQRALAERSAAMANQYSEAYYGEMEKRQHAELRIENMTAPEPVEVPVEVAPPDYQEIKAKLATANQRIEDANRRADEAERYAEEQEAAYMAARSQAQKMQARQLDEDTNATNPYSAQALGNAVRAFIGAVGTVPHMSSLFLTMPTEEKDEYHALIVTLEQWIEGTKSAMSGKSARIIAADAFVQ